jgi:hypothetical protein
MRNVSELKSQESPVPGNRLFRNNFRKPGFKGFYSRAFFEFHGDDVDGSDLVDLIFGNSNIDIGTFAQHFGRGN